MGNIGFLREVSPREAWSHEALDFTPWLAENLNVLGEELGIELEFESKERSVGGFFADIVATCPHDDRIVLIENQLEKSNHGHLGQIMTYIAGTDAQIIVWIAKDFSEPHLAALKWLNDHTEEPFAFFAVRLRVVRIGASDLAPLFEVLERPNNWERQMHAEQREKRKRSRRADDRTAYWQQFLGSNPDFAAMGVSPNGSASQWLTLDSVPDLHIAIYFALGGVGVFLRGLRGSSPADFFERFQPHVDEFKNMIGNEKDAEMWGGTTSSHPGVSLKLDLTDSGNWAQAIAWQSETAKRWIGATEAVFGENAGCGRAPV